MNQVHLETESRSYVVAIEQDESAYAATGDRWKQVSAHGDANDAVAALQADRVAAFRSS